MLKRGLLAGVALLAVGLIAVGPASATPGGKKPRYETEVTISYDPFNNEYTGTVSSEFAQCRRARFVVVKVEDGGIIPEGRAAKGGKGPQPGNDRPATVGVDRTNTNGQYKVRSGSLPPFFGFYRARVTQDIRNRYICERDVSPVMQFELPTR